MEVVGLHRSAARVVGPQVKGWNGDLGLARMSECILRRLRNMCGRTAYRIECASLTCIF